MAIRILDDKVFLLNTAHTSYAFFEDGDGILVHLYWGKRIDTIEDFDAETMQGEQGYHPNIDKKQEECSSYGMMRYKEGSLKVTYPDGVRDFRYRVTGHSVDGNHLTVTLTDAHYKFRVTLHYIVYEEEDIIERYREAENIGEEDIVLERFHSAEYPIYGTGYQSFNCNGTWADEFKPYTDSLNAGKKVYESLRGSVAHVGSPYFIIHKDANETSGDVYFGALAYSGNFKVVAEQTPYRYLNVLIGINDTDFAWTLHAGESFLTPSVYAGYSGEGFEAMSNRMSVFARRHVMPKETADEELRVLYNSWEATYFDVTCEKQMALAKKAASVGTELFVVDDGWFGERDGDHRGLGDWYVNPQKFPEGLKPLIDCVKELGMDFGIWIEPEMVNEDSALYRAHPDWIYRYETRPVLEGRYQYMLDLTNPEVLSYIIEEIDRLLRENDISYIKWDMNRALGECGSSFLAQGEFKSIWVRHVKGFYHIIGELRRRHPNVEFEACASGGGRADYGCMRYFDEFWTSDNTDAMNRLSIQETYSYLYPAKYMRAWVTDAASGEGSRRNIPLEFKMHCAMCGALGIGMNLDEASDEEFEALRRGVAIYKRIRNTVMFGHVSRLKSCHRDDFHAVSYYRDGQMVVFAFLIQQPRGKQEYLLKLRELNETACYRFELDGKTYEKSGAYLMNHGLYLHMWGDYMSKCIVLEEACAD